MKLARPIIACAAAIALGACNEKIDPVVPLDLDALSVETSSSTDTLVTGDTAFITFRFTNPSDTALTLTSDAISPSDGKPCPVLVPVAAYPGTNTVYSFILSTCFGGSDTTLTGQLQLQNITIPARGSIERVVPFTGYTRAGTTSTPRCLATGPQWIQPLFLVDRQYVFPIGVDRTDGPALLYLKPPAAGTTPCTTSST